MDRATPYSPIDVDRYRVRSGALVDVASWPTSDMGDFADKAAGREAFRALRSELVELQRLLWADGSQKLLVVLQAMDAGGKDGTIRRVFGRLNPQGVRVTGFKVPTDEEMAHDYLWRVHEHTPGSGEIAVFNRSHYEDVLVVRVLGLVPPKRWSRRYAHIKAFEKLLTDEGTTVLKFFLHVSKAEQRTRLQARVDDPAKRWKFNAGDLDHRRRWDEYMQAYSAAIAETTTKKAPWYIVPADRKWYRDIVVATAVVEALRGMNLRYPEADEGIVGTQVD